MVLVISLSICNSTAVYQYPGAKAKIVRAIYLDVIRFAPTLNALRVMALLRVAALRTNGLT
jgi:hypothetical protein